MATKEVYIGSVGPFLFDDADTYPDGETHKGLYTDGDIKGTLGTDVITKTELSYEVVSVTVAAGNSVGTGTVTSGSIILGYYPTSNQDQFVDSISVSGTTLTITLAANAVADNKFNVVLLKA